MHVDCGGRQAGCTGSGIADQHTLLIFHLRTFSMFSFFINQVVDVSNLLRGKLSSFSSSFYPLFTRPLFASSSTCSLPCFLLAAISAVFARGADCGFSDAGKIPIPSPRFMVSAAAFGLVHAIETPAPTYFLQIGQAGQARVSQIHQGEPLGCKHTDIDQRHRGTKTWKQLHMNAKYFLTPCL